MFTESFLATIASGLNPGIMPPTMGCLSPRNMLRSGLPLALTACAILACASADEPSCEAKCTTAGHCCVGAGSSTRELDKKFYAACTSGHESSMIPKALKIATLEKKMGPKPPHT